MVNRRIKASSSLRKEYGRQKFLLAREVRCGTSVSNSARPAIATSVSAPGDMDVICGRGKGSYNHNGNRHMLQKIKDNLEAYKMLQSKSDKSMMLASIRDEILAEGRRFFKRKRKGKWDVMTPTEAKAKIGHAIREAMAPNKKKNPAKDDDDSMKPVSTTTTTTDVGTGNLPVPLAITSVEQQTGSSRATPCDVTNTNSSNCSLRQEKQLQLCVNPTKLTSSQHEPYLPRWELDLISQEIAEAADESSSFELSWLDDYVDTFHLPSDAIFGNCEKS